MTGRRYDRRHYRGRPHDQNYPENQDLMRGTIFDRSQLRRGNYDLDDDYEGFDYTPGAFSWMQQDDFYRLDDDDFANFYGPGWIYTEYWREEPGPYTGLGPKGYQRSDERIYEEVCDLLSRHGQLDASQMDVRVDQGEVTLTGQVDSRRSKRIAESLAESVPGVEDVHNQLTFQRNRPGRFQQELGQEQSAFNREGGPMEESYREQYREDDRFHPGMDVIGSDSKYVGQVREVHPHDLLVDRENARDTYVPKDAVQDIRDDQLILNVASDQVDMMGWHNPHKIEIPNRDTR